MNSSLTPDPPVGLFSSDKIGGFGYGIAVSVGILLLITTITLASYFCTRTNTTSPTGTRPHRWRMDVDGGADIEAGLDEATLTSYPKVTYSELGKLKPRGGGKGSETASCSICLADYKDGDELRQLPECGHAFHLGCVDPWLRLRPTCPLCRTSPLPSPMPTPLAEVVPLARSRQGS